jgi:malate permease and related proteins
VNENLRTVLASIIEVFGLVGLAYGYARRTRFDLSSTMRIGMDVFVPCLTFTAIMDSRIAAREMGTAAAATLIQIGSGLLIGWLCLRAIRWQDKRELLMPIAFVNAANLPFPLLLANFGNEGLSQGVLCYTTMNLVIFSVGILLLHGGGRLREGLREPALWATIIAVVLRGANVRLPDLFLRIPRLAGLAAVPLMLFLFGDSLARTRLTALREAAVATVLRYLSGAAGLAIVLRLLKPEGTLRKVLILYALLPPAIINVLLTDRAGRDSRSVASAVLLATLAGIVILPLVLALAH